MSRYGKLGTNIALLTMGNFASKLLTFLLVPLYTYALTTTEYGIADLIFTMCSLLHPILSLGAYMALMRFCLDKGSDHVQLFTSSLYLTLAGTLVGLLLSPLILLSEQLAPFFVLFVLYYVAHTISIVLLYFARGVNRLRDYAISTILNTVLVIALNLFFLLIFDMGISGYLQAYIYALGVSSLYLIVRLKVWRYILPKRQVDERIMRKMLSYSIPLIPNSLSWWISNYSDKFVIVLFHGIALSGIYAVGGKIPSMLNILSTIFISAWQISSVDDFGGEASKRFFSEIYKHYVTVQVLATSFIIASSYVLSTFLYNDAFFSAWHYVPILTFGFMFHALGSFFGTVYTAVKKTKSIMVSTVLGALINILLNFLWIPRFGAYGAAIATAISYIVVFFIRIIHSRKHLIFPINYGRDILCFLILLGQVFISLYQISFQYPLGALCFVALCALRWPSLRWFLKNAIGILRKIFKTKQGSESA